MFAGVVAALTLVPLGTDVGPSLAALLVFGTGAVIAGRALQLGYPHAHLGLCNVITLFRLALTAALVAPLLMASGPSWAVFAIALVALSLDGVDGWFARRQGYVSRFGARFDMEVDSLLALVLALGAAISGGVGPLAILLGLPRYAFALGAWRLSWMRRDLPERQSRKTVCVIQLGVLIALQAPIVPWGLAVVLVAVASGALVWSFARDLIWLWRRRG
ncbi:CDP-alcohol phosphatidyltransferase family protein [Roseicyclus elongatus]|nr:CDP-alcohol phosphatidyltransferase family protein [Roseibacterium elongatum]